MSNPFFYGNPVPPDQFLDRRRELRRITSRIVNRWGRPAEARQEATIGQGSPHYRGRDQGGGGCAYQGGSRRGGRRNERRGVSSGRLTGATILVGGVWLVNRQQMTWGQGDKVTG